MADIVTYVLFFVGFAVLIKGADYLVRGASAIAGRLGVSTFVIGMTVVAFGTTVPELVVSLSASIHGNSGIVIGNAIGSNITNILLILGLSSLLVPVTIHKRIVSKELPIMLLAILVVGLLANDVFFRHIQKSSIDLEDGFMLLTFFAIYVYYIYSLAKKGAHKKEIEESGKVINHEASPWRHLLLIVAGIVGITFGGDWVVDGAVGIASEIGVSETLIGLTIIAVGTSIPELTTALTAVYRKASSLAVGNVVGANILNIFWILGISAVIRPIPIDDLRNIDIAVLIASTLMLIGFLKYFGKDNRLSRIHGAVFLFIFFTYVVFSVMAA